MASVTPTGFHNPDVFKIRDQIGLVSEVSNWTIGRSFIADEDEPKGHYIEIHMKNGTKIDSKYNGTFEEVKAIEKFLLSHLAKFGVKEFA